MIRLEKCPICDTDNWHDLDYLRNQELWYDKDYREENEPIGFKICKTCAYTTYDGIGEERLKTSYTQQRRAVQLNNLITCYRKNEYHKAFLDGYIKPDMKIIDIGCAQGEMLKMFNEYYGVPRENLFGTEYAQPLRIWAQYEYKLNVFDYLCDGEFDMISYYHVLEHVEELDKHMKYIKNNLKKDGVAYISIPIFFEELEEKSGAPCVDFEEYYHLNHINVFSRQAFINLLNKHGFEIIKEDEILYAYTVLVKHSKPKEIVKENYLTKIDIIEKQKKAIELLNQKKHKEALEIYPAFPDCYLFYSLNKENMKEFDAQKNILEEGLKHCPNNHKLISQLGKVYFQWDENTPERQGFYSNRIKKAEELFLKLAKVRPGMEDNFYFLAMIEGKYKQDYKKAIDYLKKFVYVNPTKLQESINLTSHFWSQYAEKDNR